MPFSLSRRQLLKTLGFAGVGATLIGTPFAEAMDIKPSVSARRFWWVKDQEKPTIDIDWVNMKRFNEWQSTRGSIIQYRNEMFGSEFHERLNKLQKDNVRNWEKQNKPGYGAVDHALKHSLQKWPDFKNQFMGPQKALSPQQRGMARYEGSPEENAQVVRTALQHIGAASVGFVELDSQTTMKLIYEEQPIGDQRRIVFENIDVGYETDKKLAIPVKARHAIVYTIKIPENEKGYTQTLEGADMVTYAYTQLWNIYEQLHEFIRGLGWHSYGTSEFNGLGIYPAFAVMAGLGEMSRLNRLITPESGPNVEIAVMLTDLPLSPSKPINFGVMDYCKNCTLCAQSCPAKALSLKKEPTWEAQGPWNNPGHKAYFENSVLCRNYCTEIASNCGLCTSVCPYSKNDEVTIKNIQKASVS